MPLSLHCKKFMNTRSRRVAVYFSQTSQYSSSDLSVYPHQGQNRCIFYKDESLRQDPARTTTQGCWLVTPSPGAPIPRYAFSRVYESADMLLKTKYEISVPDLFSSTFYQVERTQIIINHQFYQGRRWKSPLVVFLKRSENFLAMFDSRGGWKFYPIDKKYGEKVLM